jgi:hypothetical protein
MEFAWTPEQLKFRDSVVAFAQRDLNTDLLARDAAGDLPRELWKRCADFGIHGLPIPEEYGGTAADPLTTMLAMEALGYGCRDNGLLFAIHAHMWSIEIPILRYGTEAQKRRCLPRLVDGTWIGAHGMTEPGSGSDAFSLATRAVRKGDRYVLNGTKTFITNAPVADLALVFATLDPKKGIWGITAFLVETGTPGFSVGRKIEKMGLHTSPMAELVFEDCEVPADAVLGKEGGGHVVFNHSMGWERSCILASAVGTMQRQVETCVRYASERRQFGKPIGSFQLVASRIVDMKVRLETARLLLYKTAWSHSQHTLTPLDAALAKLYISEAAVQSALDAMQIYGGYGYMKEYEVERDLRDALAGRIYSGTSDIQRLIIGRNLGLAL